MYSTARALQPTPVDCSSFLENIFKRYQENSRLLTYDLTNLRQSLPILAVSHQINGGKNDSKRKKENNMSLTYDLTNLRHSLPILPSPLPQFNGGQNSSKWNQENSTSFTYDLSNLRHSLPILAAPPPPVQWWAECQ